MAEGCARGCVRAAVHLADCMVYDGRDYIFPCRGCAPVAVADGLAVCVDCRSRFQRYLRDVPDLIGRLRSLADPTSALVYEDRAKRTGSGSGEAPAPVPADLVDATSSIQRGLAAWALHGGRGRSEAVEAYEQARWHARAILADLDEILETADGALGLAAVVLDRHEPDEDGVREAWSIADAVAKWGVQRREQPSEVAASPSPALRPSREFDEDTAQPATEWDDPLLGGMDAAGIAGSLRTLRRWAQKGEIAPEGVIYVAGVRTPMYRRSVLRATKERMAEQDKRGQFKPADGEGAEHGTD